MSAPTLIVGLGGIGSKIVQRVYNLANEEQRKSLGFVVFDTDKNELGQIEKSSPFIKTVQTSTKLSVGEYLSIDTHARDSWFPVNALLNSKTLTEGAGQVRAISRLAFDTSIRAGKVEPLHEAIQELYKLDENAPEQALRVILVSTLAGGTGSGLLLPVALYIRNYLATRFRQSANITRGFFILPEVLDQYIPGQAERNNLRSNAYAALREIDAFLMKGDDTLPDRYKHTVKMDFPRAGSAEFEEYIRRPFDFCFLFDAQNAEGNKLNSANQYLDHAANCIYSQSIGPMNTRSSSSEDNTIRALAAERGRNRYAGAGTSMLIYPVEDVKQYIALNWAKQCVSSQWLKFDEMHKELSKENADRRNKGITVADVSKSKSYTNGIEEMAKKNDPFAKAMINACSLFAADGITKISDSWIRYVGELMNRVELDVSDGNATLDTQKDTVIASITNLEGGKESWGPFIDAYREMEKYKILIQKHSDESAYSIAYSIFRASSESVTSDKQPFRLETYLRDSEGNFIHPNAVRYFLYKVFEVMKGRYEEKVAENRDARDFFEAFVKQFDDGKTDEIETVDDLEERRLSFLDKVLKRLNPDQQALKDAYRVYVNNADEYRINAVMEKVLEEGMNYVKSLSNSIEVFFDTFDSKVNTLEKSITEITLKYGNTRGKTARYVNASKTCLEKKLIDIPYTGSFISIDGELADAIYRKVHEYASKSVKPKKDDNSFFGALFDDGIIGYFKDNLMESYSQKVDLDIIDALEEECRFEKDVEDDSVIKQYVSDTIQAIWKLSIPFIEKPLGAERQPIFACTYNPKIDPKDTSARTDLINKDLGRGAVPDDDIPKNMILFYQSFYGLRANELSKFAPPEVSQTSTRDGGEYYKAYFDLISTVHPEPHKSKAITPHIDRWWHVVTHMPDLDDGNQERQENEIFAAFFWCFIAKFIDYYGKDTENPMYRLNVDKLKMPMGLDTLVVSNGTPCDHLYEVLDALSIYPQLVSKVLDRVEVLITNEINDKKDGEDEQNALLGYLDAFRMTEFTLDGAKNKVRSIFDIPLLLRRSITTDIYQEEYVIRILKIMLSEIRRYLSRLYVSKDIPDMMSSIIHTQFERFLEGLKIEAKAYKDIYNDFLFNSICSAIQLALEDEGLRREARAIEKEVEKLKLGK